LLLFYLLKRSLGTRGNECRNSHVTEQFGLGGGPGLSERRRRRRDAIPVLCEVFPAPPRNPQFAEFRARRCYASLSFPLSNLPDMNPKLKGGASDSPDAAAAQTRGETPRVSVKVPTMKNAPRATGLSSSRSVSTIPFGGAWTLGSPCSDSTAKTRNVTLSRYGSRIPRFSGCGLQTLRGFSAGRQRAGMSPCVLTPALSFPSYD
jgi:hypothetical protein